MRKKVNKMELIKSVMESFPDLGPAAVAAKCGHGVTPQYVSFVKSKLKAKSKKANIALATLPKEMAVPKAETNGHGTTPLVDIVVQTRSLAEKCGGYDQLRKLIEILKPEVVPF